MSWFSHAVAGALYALGFGSFANLLLERAGWGLPHVPLVGAEKVIGVASRLPKPVARLAIEKAGIDRLAALYTAFDAVRRGGTVSIRGG